MFLLYSKGYISIETLVVGGLIISAGVFFVSKIVDGKRVVCILQVNGIGIKYLEIPDSVECIDDDVFLDSRNIEKVSMPKKFENDKNRLFGYKADKIQF